jgi:hypothetical protein
LRTDGVPINERGIKNQKTCLEKWILFLVGFEEVLKKMMLPYGFQTGHDPGGIFMKIS